MDCSGSSEAGEVSLHQAQMPCNIHSLGLARALGVALIGKAEAELLMKAFIP